jgi:hypothetical protein
MALVYGSFTRRMKARHEEHRKRISEPGYVPSMSLYYSRSESILRRIASGEDLESAARREGISAERAKPIITAALKRHLGREWVPPEWFRWYRFRDLILILRGDTSISEAIRAKLP